MTNPNNPDAAAAPPPAEQPDVVLDIADAAATLPDVIAGLTDGGAPVLIAADGEPLAALISPADLADLRRLRRAERRRAALAELERLNAEWAASGLGFDDEEAERIGKEFGKEINRAITERLRGRAGDARRSA
jgi:hypothetical protein